MRRIPAACLTIALLAAPAGGISAASFNERLPQPIQKHLWELIEACGAVGGRAGEPTEAVEALDLDGDGARDFILDQGRFPCRDVPPGAICNEVGCSTYVLLAWGERWRLAFDVVGGYCIDAASDPPRLVTIQKNHVVGGGAYMLNVRYRFAKGMAFQEGRGRC